VLRIGRGQCSAKIPGRVAGRAPGADGVAEDLPGRADNPVCGMQRAPGLDATRHGQQLGGGNLADRAETEIRDQVLIESRADLAPVAFYPARGELAEPFLCDGGEAVHGGVCGLLGLALCGRVIPPLRAVRGPRRGAGVRP
jgi:hypothetical protein